MERLDVLLTTSEGLQKRAETMGDLTSQTKSLEAAKLLREIIQGMDETKAHMKEFLGVCERRANHNPELYTAMAKLSTNELEQTYHSLKHSAVEQKVKDRGRGKTPRSLWKRIFTISSQP